MGFEPADCRVKYQSGLKRTVVKQQMSKPATSILCVLAADVENGAGLEVQKTFSALWLWNGAFPLRWAASYFEGHLIFGSKIPHYCTVISLRCKCLAVHVPERAWLYCLKGGGAGMFMYTSEMWETAASLLIKLSSYLCLLCQMLLLFWMFPECTVHHLMCSSIKYIKMVVFFIHFHVNVTYWIIS